MTGTLTYADLEDERRLSVMEAIWTVIGFAVATYALVAAVVIWRTRPKPGKPLYRLRDRKHHGKSDFS